MSTDDAPAPARILTRAPAREVPGDASRSGRRFRVVLLAIVAAGFALRLAVLVEYVQGHPLSTVPILDAGTYWAWAGEIAEGRLRDDQPFFSAPLYPYLLGMVRALGGGLLTIYVLQIVLDLVTAVLLAWLGRRLGGDAVGWVAAGVFLLMFEPASFCLRILPATLQLPLVALGWILWESTRVRPAWWRATLAGAALGWLALAYAPALALLPVFAVWNWLGTGRSVAALARGGLAALAGALVIAPATLHNYLASGEFIPISAQAGVTFAQGNTPDAVGIYVVLPGISRDRDEQNRDTWRIFAEETGQTPTWRAVNRHFFERGMRFWREQPWATVRLFGQKAYRFVASRHHSEIYVPTVEVREGLLTRLQWMPLHTAWLRRPGQYVAPLVLFALPLLVCLMFFYSPRYRFPVVPVVAVASAWALVQAFRWPRGRVWTALVPAGVLVGVGLGFVNQAFEIDAPGPRRVPLYVGLGWAAWQNGAPEEAVRWYEQVRAIDPEYPTIASNLGGLMAELGKPDEARAYLEEALAEAPDDAEALSRLSEVLLTQGEIAEAVARAIDSVRLRPDSPDLHNNLAYALVQAGQPEQARAHWQRALELDPAHLPARINLGQLLRLEGREDEALAAFEVVLELEPQNTTALLQVARILYRRGAVQAAIPKFWEAYGQTPDDPYLAAELAWVLATTPGLPPAYRDMALRLAHQVASGPGREVPEALDTYAAALAATGRFAEAREVARIAVQIAEAQPNVALAEMIARRLQLYESDQPYVARFGPGVPGPTSAPAATQPATAPGEAGP